MSKVESLDKASPRLFVSGGRDYSVDILRCISCFMVVVIHACRFTMPYYGYGVVEAGSQEWYGTAFCMSLAASPTVLFVMVSGIFFLTPQRNVTPRKVWTKNIPKMACAYIVWCLIYALYEIYFVMEPTPEVTFKLIAQEWLKEPGHLWYIPMIITLYMLCPFLRCITKVNDMTLYRYGIILFVGALFINTVITIPHIPYGGYMNTIIGKTPVQSVCKYACWMVFGYYLYTYRPSPKIRKMLYVAGILAVFASFAISVIVFKDSGYSRCNAINSKFTITTFFKNIALFLLVTNGLQGIQLSPKATKILSKVSNCTLMIYLIHWLFLRILFNNNVFEGVNPVVNIWLYSVITFIAGAIAGIMFQAVPWKKIRNRILDRFFPERTVLVTKEKKVAAK